MTTERTATHIIISDGAARHAVGLDDQATDCYGHEAGTFREALEQGTPIRVVDDTARGRSSHGMHGSLYIGAAGHGADRVIG